MHLFSLTANFWFWEIRVASLLFSIATIQFAICFHIFKNGTGIYFLLARNLCFCEACGAEIFLELAYLLIKCPIFYWDKFFCSLSTSQLIVLSYCFHRIFFIRLFIILYTYYSIQACRSFFRYFEFSSWEFHVVKISLGVGLKSLQIVYVIFHFLSPIFTCTHYQILVWRFN